MADNSVAVRVTGTITVKYDEPHDWDDIEELWGVDDEAAIRMENENIRAYESAVERWIDEVGMAIYDYEMMG